MKTFFRQLVSLLTGNPLHSAIIIVGTAVTIAFVMVVTMIYNFRTADIAPESDRSRLVHLGTGHIERTNGTDHSGGMAKVPFDALFVDLPGVEDVTWSSYLRSVPFAMSRDDHQLRLFCKEVPAEWFRFFDYTFVAGKPFETAGTSEEVTEAVISETAARKLAKDEPGNIVGKTIYCNFKPVTVRGVYKDVSPVFQSAYSDVLLPFRYDGLPRSHDGLMGNRLGLLKLAPGTELDDVIAEVARREKIFNSQGRDYVFHMNAYYDHTNFTFFRDTMINPRMVYALLVAVLLLVPAIGIAGLVNAQMQSRYSEMAIRKTYGATNASIIRRLFMENLVSTLVGAVAGYVIAAIVVIAGRSWMFGGVTGDVTFGSGLMLNPLTLLYATLACLVLTTVITLIPARRAVTQKIYITLKGEE